MGIPKNNPDTWDCPSCKRTLVLGTHDGMQVCGCGYKTFFMDFTKVDLCTDSQNVLELDEFLRLFNSLPDLRNSHGGENNVGTHKTDR